MNDSLSPREKMPNPMLRWTLVLWVLVTLSVLIVSPLYYMSKTSDPNSSLLGNHSMLFGMLMVFICLGYLLLMIGLWIVAMRYIYQTIRYGIPDAGGRKKTLLLFYTILAWNGIFIVNKSFLSLMMLTNNYMAGMRHFSFMEKLSTLSIFPCIVGMVFMNYEKVQLRKVYTWCAFSIMGLPFLLWLWGILVNVFRNYDNFSGESLHFPHNQMLSTTMIMGVYGFVVLYFLLKAPHVVTRLKEQR